MRSRVIVKCREWFGNYGEKIMEWLHTIKYRAIPVKRTMNNLIEEYIIQERYAGEQYVKDFLKERTNKALMNRYCIKIKTEQQKDINTQNKENYEEIGKVMLLRKRSLIDEATLIIKKDNSNLIYWKFKK